MAGPKKVKSLSEKGGAYKCLFRDPFRKIDPIQVLPSFGHHSRQRPFSSRPGILSEIRWNLGCLEGPAAFGGGFRIPVVFGRTTSSRSPDLR
jgi:hypothetical protein